MKMKELIKAIELPPGEIDFYTYFDNDGFRGEYAFYIPATRNTLGFNSKEYKEIVRQIEILISAFEDFHSGCEYMQTLEDVLDEGMVTSSTKDEFVIKSSKLQDWYNDYQSESKRLKKWDIDADLVADFLTIATGNEWRSEAFRGYSQGDYCEVVYPVNRYSREAINEIGYLWLSCGTEFVIDGCRGYFVLDVIRWQDGDVLRNKLAEISDYNPDELEIHLYKGEKTIPIYEVME